MATVAKDFEAADRRLRRNLSLSQLYFLSMGAIIGSGWLFASLAADSVAGPASAFSWIIGGILVLLIALNYAEISGMLPRSGAIVRYPHYTHGGYTGFIIGWAYLLSAVSVPAIEAEAVVTYASSYDKALISSSGVLSGEGILLAIVLMVLFFFVNYFGIRFLGQFNQWITVWKFVIPTLTFLLIFVFASHGSNFGGLPGGVAPMGLAPMFGAISTTGIIFSYLGFRQALDYGGEAANPQRDIPRATIYSVVTGIVLYTVLQVAFTMGLNWHALGLAPGAWAKLSTTGAITDAPFYLVLKSAGVGLLGAFGTILLIDAFVSPTGTGYIYLGTSARTVYGLSSVGYLPKWFQSISERYRIPWTALVASVVVGCLFFAPLPSWYTLVGLITGATALTYIMGGVGLQVLRRTAGGMHRPYRLGSAQILSPLGFLAAVLIVYWSGFAPLVTIFAAVFVALPVFAWYYAPRRGWIQPTQGYVLGAVFLVVWVVTQRWGLYVLTAPGTITPAQHPAFAIFFLVQVAEV
ncbi:MAG TPA: APC family permease, partial [Candidatus Dormibacteraeota bacterium]|nr:APC family permease [Candidatus Dormibacteraeota bacterium]